MYHKSILVLLKSDFEHPIYVFLNYETPNIQEMDIYYMPLYCKTLSKIIFHGSPNYHKYKVAFHLQMAIYSRVTFEKQTS